MALTEDTCLLDLHTMSVLSPKTNDRGFISLSPCNNVLLRFTFIYQSHFMHSPWLHLLSSLQTVGSVVYFQVRNCLSLPAAHRPGCQNFTELSRLSPVFSYYHLSGIRH